VVCFLDMSFGSLYVTCKLHNNRSPIKKSILFSSRLGHTHSFTRGPYAAFHGMALTCLIEGIMITAVWTYLRMFLNSNIIITLFICWILLRPVLRAWTVTFTFQYRPWAGSIKPNLQYFQCCLKGFCFTLFFDEPAQN
jgi:hypothetical protein